MKNLPQKEMIGSDDDQTTKHAGDQKILAKLAQEMGRVPNPLQLMALRPGTVETFMTYRNQISEGGPLNKKEQALIALSAATALKSPQCSRTHSNNARKAGATEDEIVQTMLIASLLSGLSPLHIAYAAIREE